MSRFGVAVAAGWGVVVCAALVGVAVGTEVGVAVGVGTGELPQAARARSIPAPTMTRSNLSNMFGVLDLEWGITSLSFLLGAFAFRNTFHHLLECSAPI